MNPSVFRDGLKCVVAVGLLSVGNLAFAAEPVRAAGPQKGTNVRKAHPAQARALTYPVRTAGQEMRIDAELRLAGEVIMSEWRSVRGDAQRVNLFHRGAEHFAALRDQDARNPGRVQVRISQNGDVVVDMSLTEFDMAYGDGVAQRIRGITTNEPCAENCELYYQDCLSWCDPRGSECANCWYQYENCMASCPTCDDWEEVDRTLLRRRYSGGANILGVKYCNFEEYYLVEETNPAGCYANRFVCDYDDDTIFAGWGTSSPSQSECCNSSVGPGDENYCGGTDTTCG